ncbi:MAG TPA: hypothetical protein VEQ40_11285 [Pyrinomonadaceae bacterium]|nr:hypothetical protein [Pyrinomonadaceae bacterium]
MTRRRITLADGRYLIFYTFGEAEAETAPDMKSEAKPAEPEPVPEAEEERGV